MNTISFVIGRFQPFHLGHKALIDKALINSKRVVVFIGSSNESRTKSNPFTTEERMTIISSCFDEKELKRILFIPLPDFTDNQDWLNHIKSSLVLIKQSPDLFTFVCADKDPSTAKNNFLVSQLPCVDTYTMHPPYNLNARDIRLALEVGADLNEVEGILPPTIKYLCKYNELIEESNEQ